MGAQANEKAIHGYPDAEKVFENSESQIMVEVLQGRSVTREAVQVSRCSVTLVQD